MILEKVYDELYGMIEDLKKKIQAAEKSDVTITPALESGTKVADFEIDGTEGSIFAPTPPLNFGDFSETETEIGTWINGEKLFRKVVDFGTLPNTTTKSVAHNISNLNTITSIMTISASTNYSMNIPFVHPSDTTKNILLIVSASEISITTGSDRSPYTKTYCVLEYTKTTTQNTRKKSKKED